MFPSSDNEHVRTSLNFEEFFADFWRKKPLFIKGGAIPFLNRTWNSTDFDAALEQAREVEGAVMEREGEVTFIEQVSRFNEDLAQRVFNVSELFGSPTAWFDSIRTYKSQGGIGEHFDHSDNFVLQQEGVKHWSLGSPQHISKAQIAARMMNQPAAGGHDLPDRDLIAFTLEPGDLLYIPLFWLHSGISDEESLSLSLVCPATSLQAATIPILTNILKTRALGYQPLPALHSGLTKSERKSAEENIEKATLALLKSLSSEKISTEVIAIQSARLKNDRPSYAV